MPKLIVTADIHGSFSAWRNIVQILKKGDALAVAGDLFDTRYGDWDSSDYEPEKIRDEFLNLSKNDIDTHIVRGNCDHPDFINDFELHKHFYFQGFSFFMSHGHRPLPEISDVDVVIEGHSHKQRLATMFGMVFLNPGSPERPRRSHPGYAIFEDRTVKLIKLPKHKVLDKIVMI